jgi:hypothetical protein
MIIKSKNTQVLESSIRFNEDATAITYQANTEIYVDGNPYLDLVTPKTIFNLTCSVTNVANIMSITQDQIDAYILANYPEV